MADEIYLRYYVQLLVKRWPLIRDVVIVVVLATLVFGVIMPGMVPPTFTAKSYIGLVRSRATVVFDQRIQLASQDAASGPRAASEVRLNSVVRLVKHPSIATAVAPVLQEKIPLSELLGMVSAKLIDNTELIEIKAVAGKSELAVEVANAWAKEYTKLINTLYAETPSEQLTLESQIANNKARYQEAQARLVDFTRSSNAESLQQRARLFSIAVSYLTANTNKEALDIPPEFSIVPPELRAIRELATFYQTKLKLQGVNRDAMSLQTQLEGGGDAEAFSSQLAVLVLKTQAFSSAPASAPVSIQLTQSVGSNDRMRLLQDVASLVKAVQSRLVDLDAQIQFNARSLLPAGSTQSGQTEDLIKRVVQGLNAEINSIQAQILAETSRKKELSNDFDLAWNTYTALAQKLEEQRAQRAFAAKDVDAVLPAVEATSETKPWAQRTPVLLISGLGAAIFGLVVGFVLETLRPELETPSVGWALRRLRRKSRPKPSVKDQQGVPGSVERTAETRIR